MENLNMILLQMDGFEPGRMWFFPLFFFVICIILFLFYQRGGRGPFFFGRTRHLDNRTSAIDILNNRYAKGEITKEEYDRMKKDIS